MFQRQKGIKSYQINSFPRQASCPYAVSTAPAVFGIYYYILYRTFCQGKYDKSEIKPAEWHAAPKMDSVAANSLPIFQFHTVLIEKFRYCRIRPFVAIFPNIIIKQRPGGRCRIQFYVLQFFIQ